MAVGFTLLDANNTTANNAANVAYTTASVIPTANQPVLLCCGATASSGTNAQPTVSGCGLTWTMVAAPAPGTRGGWVFLGIGASPTTGAISMSFSVADTGCFWGVVQCDSVDTTTANGVVQNATGKPTAVTSISQAFAATVGAGNGALEYITNNVGDATTAVGAGWTQLTQQLNTAPVGTMVIGVSTNPPQQTVSASWTTSGNTWFGAVELKAATSGNLNDVKSGSGNVNLAVGSSPASAAYIGSTQVWP